MGKQVKCIDCGCEKDVVGMLDCSYRLPDGSLAEHYCCPECWQEEVYNRPFEDLEDYE